MKRDLILYGTIGALTAATPFVATGDLPHWLGAPVAIILGALVAIKAKFSQSPDDQPPT